jgi:hypothetical protein
VADASPSYTASPWSFGYHWWLRTVPSKIHSQWWTKGGPQTRIHYLEQEGSVSPKCDHLISHWKCISHCLLATYFKTDMDKLDNQVCLIVQVKDISSEEAIADTISRTKSLVRFLVDYQKLGRPTCYRR